MVRGCNICHVLRLVLVLFPLLIFVFLSLGRGLVPRWITWNCRTLRIAKWHTLTAILLRIPGARFKVPKIQLLTALALMLLLMGTRSNLLMLLNKIALVNLQVLLGRGRTLLPLRARLPRTALISLLRTLLRLTRLMASLHLLMITVRQAWCACTSRRSPDVGTTLGITRTGCPTRPKPSCPRTQRLTTLPTRIRFRMRLPLLL